jgi:hypothetical protein
LHAISVVGMVCTARAASMPAAAWAAVCVGEHVCAWRKALDWAVPHHSWGYHHSCGHFPSCVCWRVCVRLWPLCFLHLHACAFPVTWVLLSCWCGYPSQHSTQDVYSEVCAVLCVRVGGLMTAVACPSVRCAMSTYPPVRCAASTCEVCAGMHASCIRVYMRALLIKDC